MPDTLTLNTTCRICDAVVPVGIEVGIIGREIVRVQSDFLSALDGWTYHQERDYDIQSFTPEQVEAASVYQWRRGWVCGDCLDTFNEEMGECEDCGRECHEDFNPLVFVNISDRYVCEVCYSEEYNTCHDCDRTYHYEDGWSVGDGEYSVCSYCREDYSYCESCDMLTHGDEMLSREDLIQGLYTSDEDELAEELEADDLYDYLCTYCADDRGWMRPESYRRQQYSAPPERGILNYSYRPPRFTIRVSSKTQQQMREFVTTRGKHVHIYGMEIEVENNGDDDIQARAAEINHSYGGDLFYCKSDASIRNGFEIVTHPCTFEWWQEEGQDILDAMFAQLREHGYSSYRSGRCGLHIHTNRQALTRIQTYNYLRFMHDRTVTPKLKKLSGRSDNSMESYASLSLSGIYSRLTGRYQSVTPYEYGKMVLTDTAFGGHSHAVNISSMDTAELRLFRGSLKTQRVMGALEFYNAALDFCDPDKGVLKVTEKPHWTLFRNYIEDHPTPKAVKNIKAVMQEAEV